MRGIFYLFICFMLVFNFAKAEVRNKKYALIVAVSDYPETTGWNYINSDNDVGIIKDALLRQGFRSQDISVVLNENATKQKILDQLEQLTSKVIKGDIVVIHFSGHGQQIADDNNDEPDGYDESFIPYDAGKIFSEEYKGENHLRDDEINIALAKLRSQLGTKGNVLVILDSCHSGTATRGYQKSRGTNLKFQPSGYNPEQNTEDFGLLDVEIVKSKNSSIAPLVAFSASSPDQLNYEYTDKETGVTYGSLSYAFSKAVSKIDSDATYRGLFDRIMVEMSNIAPNQTPQAEGDLDQLVFDGKAKSNNQHFAIVDSIDTNTYVLNAGSLFGIYENTRLEFYDIDTYDYKDKQPKFTGIVTDVSTLTSNIKIKGTTNLRELKPLWGYVISQTFGNLDVKIDIEGVKDNHLKIFLSYIIQLEPNIVISNHFPDIIITTDNENSSSELLFYTPDEYLMSEINIAKVDDQQLKDQVLNVIKHYFQANFLRGLELKTNEFDVLFEIIPVKLKKQGNVFVIDKEIQISKKYNNTNQLVFNEEDAFKLKIINKGNSKAYFQILDIQPDNKVNILIPTGNNTPSDYIIYPGEEKVLLEIFTIGKPYGKEVFKLVATSKPMDLSYIVKTRGGSKKDNESPFEILFRNSFEPSRGKDVKITPEAVSIYSLPFIIAK